MDNQGCTRQFEVAVRLQCRNDGADVRYKQGFEIRVRDIAGGHNEELIGLSNKKIGVDEICVFGDYDATFTQRERVDLSVGGPIASRQI